MNRLSALCLCGIFGIVGYWFVDDTRAMTVASIFRNLVAGNTEIDQDHFQQAALREVNARRSEQNLAALKADPQIHEALSRFGATQNQLASAELEPLFATLQRQFPGAQYLSATVLLDPSDTGLQSSLAEWDDAGNPQYESLSTLAFRDGLRQGCIAVLSRRLPPFDLEAANRDGGRYFQTCPHCQKAHAIQLDRAAQTVILACPDCKKPYDVLAADPDGVFRRATEYFEGFELPVPVSPPSQLPVDRMIAIWAAVLTHCDYEYDHKGSDKGEAWKLPSRTWSDGRGDCEDSSLLLADALNSAGIEARVAVGWNIHIGQHAWCVARAGGRQWILESTLRLKPGQQPKPVAVADGADEYQPEQLIEPGRLHFRLDGRVRAGCPDYWSPDHWGTLAQ